MPDFKKAIKALRTKKILLVSLIIVVLIILLGTSLYLYQKSKTPQSSDQASSAQVNELVKQVGKLMELPTGEDPTLATVSDKTKLKDQSFFINAENGDKVLIYTKAKKAILYRPSINKIIEVGSINLGEAAATTPQPQPQPSQQPKNIRVAIYNGTGVTGLAKSAGTNLSSEISNMEIVKTGDSSGNYEGTLVIDISGSNGSILSKFTGVVGGKTQVTLPSGEAKPDADILVILGQDFANKQ